MRNPTLSMSIFAASALAGPLIRFVLWPPSNLDEGSLFRNFIYDLVLLLWPTQPLAVVEVSIGAFLAVTVSVVANILLFAVMGVIAGILAGNPAKLLGGYVLVCAMLLVLALWNAGFSFTHMNLIALSVACVLYALPFWAVFHLTEDSRIGRHGPTSQISP